MKCPQYKGVRIMEVSVTRVGLTVHGLKRCKLYNFSRSSCGGSMGWFCHSNSEKGVRRMEGGGC